MFLALWFCSAGLSFWKVSWPYSTTLRNKGAWSFARKAIVRTTKVCLLVCLREMDKTFSNGNMQIKDFNLAIGKGLY